VFRRSGGRFAIPLLPPYTDSHRETLPSLTPIVAGVESARSRAGAAGFGGRLPDGMPAFRKR
jgi:hypothetical protein